MVRLVAIAMVAVAVARGSATATTTSTTTSSSTTTLCEQAITTQSQAYFYNTASPGTTLPSDRKWADCDSPADAADTTATDCYAECKYTSPTNTVSFKPDPPPNCSCFFPPFRTRLENNRWIGFVDHDGDGCFETSGTNSNNDTPIAALPIDLPASHGGGTSDYGWSPPGETWLPSYSSGWHAGSPAGVLNACVSCAGRRCDASAARPGQGCLDDDDCQDGTHQNGTCALDCCEGFCNDGLDENYFIDQGVHNPSLTDAKRSPPSANSSCRRRCAGKQDQWCVQDSDCGANGPCGVRYCQNDASIACTCKTFKRCKGGSNDDTLCTQASDCPGGTCEYTCSNDTACPPLNAGPCRVLGFCMKHTTQQCLRDADCGSDDECATGHFTCTAPGDVQYDKCEEQVSDRTALPEGIGATMGAGGTRGNYVAQLKTEYGFTTPGIVATNQEEDLTGLFPLDYDMQIQGKGTVRNYAYGGWKTHDPGTSLRVKGSNVVVGPELYHVPYESGHASKGAMSVVYGQNDPPCGAGYPPTCDPTASHENISLWAADGCVVGGKNTGNNSQDQEVRVNQDGTGPKLMLIQAPGRIDFDTAGKWTLQSKTDADANKNIYGGVVFKSCTSVDSTFMSSMLNTCTENGAHQYECQSPNPAQKVCRQGSTINDPLKKYCRNWVTRAWSDTACDATTPCPTTCGCLPCNYICDTRSCTGTDCPGGGYCPTGTRCDEPVGTPARPSGFEDYSDRICVKDWTAVPQLYCKSSGLACTTDADCGCTASSTTTTTVAGSSPQGCCVVRICAGEGDCPDPNDSCLPPISSTCGCAAAGDVRCDVPECSHWQ